MIDSIREVKVLCQDSMALCSSPESSRRSKGIRRPLIFEMYYRWWKLLLLAKTINLEEYSFGKTIDLISEASREVF